MRKKTLSVTISDIIQYKTNLSKKIVSEIRVEFFTKFTIADKNFSFYFFYLQSVYLVLQVYF